MAIKKKLTKVGNSSAIILDKATLALLDLDAESAVKISLGEDGKSLVLRKLTDEEKVERRKKSEAIIKEDLTRNAEVYRRLADM